MLSQISNTASREAIEDAFRAKFDYGYLYQPKFVINGMKESTLPIITADALDRIQFGIWGILPKGYCDSWKSFQTVYNTLEIEYERIPETSWLFETLKYRRCLIIATGYFVSELENNSLQTFQNVLRDQDIFCFAGIYNILEDGFISCSILTHSNEASPYHFKNPQPVIINQENHLNYLKGVKPIKEICSRQNEMDKSKLQHFESSFVH